MVASALSPLWPLHEVFPRTSGKSVIRSDDDTFAALIATACALSAMSTDNYRAEASAVFTWRGCSFSAPACCALTSISRQTRLLPDEAAPSVRSTSCNCEMIVATGVWRPGAGVIALDRAEGIMDVVLLTRCSHILFYTHTSRCWLLYMAGVCC